MIYISLQTRNEETKILPFVATSHTNHFCQQHNHDFALLIFMPRFKSIDFIKILLKYQITSKIKIHFCEKYRILQRRGALLPDSQWLPAAGGYAKRPPKQPPQLQTFSYAPSARMKRRNLNFPTITLAYCLQFCFCGAL